MTSQDLSTVHIIGKPPILFGFFKLLPSFLLLVCNHGVRFTNYLAQVRPLGAFRWFLWTIVSWSSCH